MPYNPSDYYARKAKEENFAARSIYKLQEIDKKFKIIHHGNYIMDLGASPGSWSQYASEKIGIKGKILGIDLKPVAINLPNAVFIIADLNDLDVNEVIIKNNFPPEFDAVISDMAPNTTGNKFTDQARSFDLCVLALATAKKFLKPEGNFICKIFDGEDAMMFRDQLKNNFSEVHTFRPKSTQSSSKEMFMIGKGFQIN